MLDLVRGQSYARAVELLDHTDRGAAPVVAKLLRSAAANAEHNEGLDPGELYVSTAYADEGTTLKRWRPRARGRATRIRKRTCHITVILARMPEDQIVRLRARVEAEAADRRARRVAGTRRRRGDEEAPLAAAETDLAPGRRERGAVPSPTRTLATLPRSEHEAVPEDGCARDAAPRPTAEDEAERSRRRAIADEAGASGEDS